MPKTQRGDVKQALKELLLEGKLKMERGRSFGVPGKMKLTRGRIEMTRRGNAFVIPDNRTGAARG